MVDGGFGAAGAGGVFQLPCVATFVVEQTGVVVAFVEVFEDGGEDFGELFWEGDSLRGGFEELATADRGEEGGGGEDVFVSCEQALLRTDAKGYDGRGQVAVGASTLENHRDQRERI